MCTIFGFLILRFTIQRFFWIHTTIYLGTNGPAHTHCLWHSEICSRTHNVLLLTRYTYPKHSMNFLSLRFVMNGMCVYTVCAINRYLLAIVVDISREISFMTLNMTHINFACVCACVYFPAKTYHRYFHWTAESEWLKARHFSSTRITSNMIYLTCFHSCRLLQSIQFFFSSDLQQSWWYQPHYCK